MSTSLVNIFLILFLTISSQTLSAQKIEIVQQPIHPDGFVEYNLGRYKKGKKQPLLIEIKNDSKQPLQIKSLELSCDCLSASALPPMALPAGAIFRLKIIHKATYAGAFQTFAILRSDALNYPELWLKLSGEVIKKKQK
jgi:hypothetical protein